MTPKKKPTTKARPKVVPANKAKDGPAVMDAMQLTVTLDRFYDRNPRVGTKAQQRAYIEQVVRRNRAARAMVIAAKEDK